MAHASSAAVVNLVFGTLGVGNQPAPALLDPVFAPVPLTAMALADVAVTEAMEVADAGACFEDEANVAENDEVPPHDGDDKDHDGDGDQCDSHDGDRSPHEDIDDDGGASVAPFAATEEDEGAVGTAYHGTNEVEERFDDSVGDAAEYRVFDDLVGLLGCEVGALGVQRRAAVVPRHVMYSSTAERIRAYYERMPEASQSVPVIDPFWAGRPSRFSSPALRGALRFALTAGGSGLSAGDQAAFAATMRAVERAAVRGTAARGPITSAFVTDHGFLTATRHEMNRVLAERDWQEVAMTVGDRPFVYYYRDLLKVGLDTLASAAVVSFGPNDDAADSDATGGVHMDSTAVREQMQDKTGITGTDTDPLGRERNRDKTLIHCTLIGSQSPSRTADSSMVPHHYPHHYSRSVTIFSTVVFFIGTIRKGHEGGRRRPRPPPRSPTATTTPIHTVIKAKTEPSPSPSTTGTPTNKHLARTH